MISFVLAGLAVLLAWVAPGLMARQKGFRRAPRSALVAWQAVAVGGILAALTAAPAATPLLLDGEDPMRHLRLVAPAVLLSALVLGRLLYSGHHVGTRLRRVRADHRQLVDIVARQEQRMRILEHPTPTAYCIPGRQSRVVISQGVLDALPQAQLEAVLAHEDAHLRERHDLLLEFFAVVHSAVPGPLRSPEARGGSRPDDARRQPGSGGRPRCGQHGAGAATAACRRSSAPRAARRLLGLALV